MGRPFRASFKVAVLFVCCILALISPSAFPENAPATSGSATPYTFGQAVAPLYRPWKFQVGDSPVDRATNKLLWADPNYDDSDWETVDLTPRPGVVDPFTGDPSYVPGWTTQGHPGYWGYAWYRIRVAALAGPGEKLAVMANGVDDGYQVFAQGHLLGSNGEFRAGKYPVVYFPQPAMFVLPSRACSVSTRAADAGAGVPGVDGTGTAFASSLHRGNALCAAAGRERRNRRVRLIIEWMELVQYYAFSGLLIGAFLLLSLVAASLTLFDRSDRVYLWVATAILLAMSREIAFSLANWTHLVSIREFFIFLEGFDASAGYQSVGHCVVEMVPVAPSLVDPSGHCGADGARHALRTRRRKRVLRHPPVTQPGRSRRIGRREVRAGCDACLHRRERHPGAGQRGLAGASRRRTYAVRAIPERVDQPAIARDLYRLRHRHLLYRGRRTGARRRHRVAAAAPSGVVNTATAADGARHQASAGSAAGTDSQDAGPDSRARRSRPSIAPRAKWVETSFRLWCTPSMEAFLSSPETWPAKA